MYIGIASYAGSNVHYDLAFINRTQFRNLINLAREYTNYHNYHTVIIINYDLKYYISYEERYSKLLIKIVDLYNTIIIN